MTFTISEIALRYASLGWQVIPVEGKRPVGTEWQKRASSDQAAVARLFAQAKTADGVGVQLGERSGIIDFDIDSPEADATFNRLVEGCPIFKTPHYQSARGKHYLFRWNDRIPGGSIKIVIDGLEIRLGNGSMGCQSVFPPSGGREWVVDPFECPLADIPEIVIERIKARYEETHKPKPIQPQPFTPTGCQPEDALDVPRWLAKHGQTIIGRTEGGDGTTRWHIECPGVDRHTTDNSYRDCCITQSPTGILGGGCFHSSCGMADWPTLRDTIGSLTWDDFNEPLPIHTGEWFSGTDATPDAPGSPDDKARLPVNAVPATTVPEPVSPSAMNETFYDVPGLIGDMIAFHREYAPRPRPELSLVASIALMGAITGRKIQTRSGMRTNIYCIGLANSGSGKDKPRLNNIMAMTEAGLDGYLGAENPASDSALIGELAENPSLLIQIDEVSRYFSTLKSSGNNVHLKNVQTRFMELTGAAENPKWAPKGWADQTKKKVISHPNLCIYGTSTADGFWSSVSAGDAVDGFLARMMVVEAGPGYPRLRDTEKAPTPTAIIDIMKAWHEYAPGGDLAGMQPQATIVYTDSAAVDRIRIHSDGIEDRLGDEPDDQKAIWSRCSALAKRLSLIFAASRGPIGLGVTLSDANKAVKLANWCTRLLIRRVFTSVAHNENDNEKKKVLTVIRRAGEISSSDLTRKTQWLKDGNARNRILADLIEAEYIVQVRYEQEEGKAGRPRNAFKIITSSEGIELL